MARTKTTTNDTGANVGYEAKLWQMADALRGSMDSGAYSGEDDRLFRRNVTGDSGEFALRVFSTLVGHDQSRFRVFPGPVRSRIRHRFCDPEALAV